MSINDQNIEQYQNIRWFLLFQDVKMDLKALYAAKNQRINDINDMNLEDYVQVEKLKRNIRMEDWNIVSQI